ncbi:MAG: DUF559 domain-containing protein [Novosphingobium sp.]|uniref:endonuclease domain-containing protein n=1 Tax=Novosphingobium sp. TaxID=1874826 RepID=UPI003C7C5DD5
MHDHGSGTVDRARQLRNQLSLPEALLWRLLKPKPMGVKFRSQHPLGDYVVDFFCHSARTVFEIDGIAHDMGNQPEFDIRRDVTLKALGYSVVRIAATEVLKDPEAIASSMVRHCLATSSSGVAA